jgi:hypothetical protein
MSKIKSSKAKGRRLQNFVRDELREAFPSLEEDDIKSQTMGMTGEDIVLSPAARKVIPYCFECKNQERLDLWGSLKQALSHLESEAERSTAKRSDAERHPVLVIKRNRSKTYAVIEFDNFLNLIKEENGL